MTEAERAARWRLDGKRALVTGGTRGIGAAVAAELKGLGATVFTLARSGADIDADLSEPGEAARAVDEAVKSLGGLDILVSNVGTNVRAPTDGYRSEDYDVVFATNLTSAWEICRAARAPLSASGDGAIVTVGSVASRIVVGSGAPYAMSKAALDQLTRYLAMEWAGQNIRVNGVLPWYTDTPLAAPVLTDAPRLERILARTPNGRVAAPEDVAAAAAFLCLPAARHVTGALLPVDGGFLALGLSPGTV